MLIDSHAHIDGPEFDDDRQDVIERAHAAGVRTILNVGTGDPHSDAFERAIALSEQYPSIYSAIGTHPHDAKLYNAAAEAKTKQLIAEHDRVVAWGEIGLDFHYDNSPREVQISAFASQLRSACELDLPVIIHTREAESETIELLKSEFGNSSRRGVFHCFSGSLELAKAGLDLGFMISFSGIVTFKKADELRDVARFVPADRILVETDCPFLAPVPYRGKRNEPSFVTAVAQSVAETRGVSLTDLKTSTAENFVRLFNVSVG